MTDRIDRATRQDVYAWIDRRFDDFVEELRAYARVPTISARREAEAEGADATRALLERQGIQVRLMDVPGGPPLVVGEVAGASAGPPLILYNHYDVQPVDPVEQWRRAPFDPVVEDGKLFARGVADTKGNTAAQAFAQAAVREVVGHLPVSLRFMVEGEEEVGSPHLPAFARQHPALFKGAGATIEGAGHTPQGVPEVYLGSKGIKILDRDATTLVADPADTFGGPMRFTTAAVPGDPRD